MRTRAKRAYTGLDRSFAERVPMSKTTAEIRWFVSAKERAEIDRVDEWFHRLGSGGDEDVPQLVDVYVVDASSDELGLKTSDGGANLEIKTLAERHFVELFFGPRPCTAQLWTKVSTASLVPRDALLGCRVAKRRSLRRYGTEASYAQKLPHPGALPSGGSAGPPSVVGCVLEWSAVEIDGLAGEWRTLCFEAFATNQRTATWAALQGALQKTLNAVEPAPRLGAPWRELSYPGLLASTIA